MPLQLEIEFASLTSKLEPNTLVLMDSSLALNKPMERLDKESDGQISRIMKAMKFTGKVKSGISIAVPMNSDLTNLILLGASEALAR